MVLGYALLALLVIYVCVCATDLYLAQKRLDTAADAAALAAADTFVLTVVDGAPRPLLDDATVWDEAVAVLSTLDRAELVSASAPDGVSARVSVRSSWAAPILSAFIPAAVELTSTATSRTALR